MISISLQLLCAVLLTALALYQWKWIRTSIGNADWKQSLMYSWLKIFRRIFLEAFNWRSNVNLTNCCVLLGIWYDDGFLASGCLIVWIPATLLIGIPVLIVLINAECVLEPSDGENGGNG